MKKYELVKKTTLTHNGYQVYYYTTCDGKIVPDTVKLSFNQASDVFKMVVENNGIVKQTEIILTVEK